MSGSINRATVLGNLGADPDIRRTQDGRPIATLSIATSETWRDKESGERKERTQWHRIVIFNEGLCKVVEQYLKKGSKAYIEGQMETRKWTDQGGVDRYTTGIVLRPYNGTLVLLGDSRGNGVPPNDGSGEAGRDYKTGDRPGAAPRGAAGKSDMDDDIPF